MSADRRLVDALCELVSDYFDDCVSRCEHAHRDELEEWIRDRADEPFWSAVERASRAVPTWAIPGESRTPGLDRRQIASDVIAAAFGHQRGLRS